MKGVSRNYHTFAGEDAVLGCSCRATTTSSVSGTTPPGWQPPPPPPPPAKIALPPCLGTATPPVPSDVRPAVPSTAAGTDNPPRDSHRAGFGFSVSSRGVAPNETTRFSSFSLSPAPAPPYSVVTKVPAAFFREGDAACADLGRILVRPPPSSDRPVGGAVAVGGWRGALLGLFLLSCRCTLPPPPPVAAGVFSIPGGPPTNAPQGDGLMARSRSRASSSVPWPSSSPPPPPLPHVQSASLDPSRSPTHLSRRPSLPPPLTRPLMVPSALWRRAAEPLITLRLPLQTTTSS